MTGEDFDFLAHQNAHPELYFSGEDIDKISPQRISEIGEMLTERQLRPIMHAPFYDLNPGARDSLVKKASMDRLLWAVDVANRLGVAQIVVHPGYGPWVRGRRIHHWLARAKEGIQKVIDKAGVQGIRMAFENVYDESPDDLMVFLEGFSGDNIGVCLDIGHFHVFSKISLGDWLEVLGPKIYEFHIHDNHGESDEHLAIGDGTIDYTPWIKWVEAHPSQAYLTLEQPEKTHVIKSINLLRQWFQVKNPSEQGKQSYEQITHLY